jgi:hypothetical protein
MHDESAVHTTEWEMFLTMARVLKTKTFWHRPAGKACINWNKLLDFWVNLKIYYIYSSHIKSSASNSPSKSRDL